MSQSTPIRIISKMSLVVQVIADGKSVMKSIEILFYAPGDAKKGYNNLYNLYRSCQKR